MSNSTAQKQVRHITCRQYPQSQRSPHLVNNPVYNLCQQYMRVTTLLHRALEHITYKNCCITPASTRITSPTNNEDKTVRKTHKYAKHTLYLRRVVSCTAHLCTW